MITSVIIAIKMNGKTTVRGWKNINYSVFTIEVPHALEQKNIEARVDCRSFKERGIDEQPTIHEGVTARMIEQRSGVSERCELNRQIRKD